MLPRTQDPIVAVATAPGRGAVGIVRASGRDLGPVMHALCGRALAARHATYLPFLAADGSTIDQGLAIHFPAPHSYTGEEVLELQAHGGPVVLQLLLARCLEAGAGIGLRVADPGEFTQRAYLNDKRLRVAARKRLADSVIACGLPHLGRGDLKLGLRELGAVQDKVAGLRRFGAAALDLAFVAAGRLDGYWERNISPWDIAAGLILVREAGGFVTDLDGGDGMNTKKHIVAGNEPIHRELLKALKPAS